MAIAYVASGENYSAAATSLTVTLTPSGSDRFVVVSALTGDGNFLGVPKSGGAGGSDMTVITTAVVSAQYHQMYYYIAPPASSTEFYQPVSGSRGFDMAAVVYSGVKQTSGAIDSFAAIASGAVPRTFSTTVVASDCWLVSMARNVTTGVVAPHTGTTGRTNGTLHDTGDSNGTVGTGSQSMAWTDSSGSVYGIIFSLAPATAAGPANLKSYDTNLTANIKSINTNLIANIKSLNTNV
jgi:hypothetical protein